MTSPSRSTATQMALLLIATAVLGTASHWVNPRRIPWRQDWSNYVQQKASEFGVPVVSLDEARLIVDRQSHIILDARPAADYAAGHLPGAFALPHAALETYLPPLQPLLSPSQPMMTYCSGLECDESLLLTRELHAMGFTNAVLFAGGMTAWRAAGLKVER